jgi:ABC-type glutathione transport system ATPase component
VNNSLVVQNVSSAYTVRKGFGRKTVKPILNDVSLEIAPGEICGLVGESGSGKTTLGRCILGLVDYEGEITVDGMRQRSGGGTAHRREMARRVQAVFQDPAASLNPAKRVGWLLEEPLRIHGVSGAAERRRRAGEMLDLVGLDGAYRDRRVNELSLGQKQRVSIGCALMLNPGLIIADEPVSSLDVSIAAQILNLFRDLHERLGLALLFISHNLDLVYWFCSRIAVMEKGRIVEQGAAEDLYRSPQHPYTQKLLEAGR